MYFITKTESTHLIEAILNEPSLFALTNGQESRKWATAQPGFEYLLITDKHNVMGMFSIRHVSKLVVEGHIRIMPRYWKTTTPAAALRFVYKYLKENHKTTKVITTVPANCRHVMRFMKEQRFKRFGVIKKGIVYNKKLTNLIYFEKRI